MGITREVDTRCDSLLPCPINAKFLPLGHSDSDYAGPLWSRRTWPLTVPQGHQGFWAIANKLRDRRELAEDPYGTVFAHGSATRNKILVEFRFYLFYLFRYYQVYYQEWLRKRPHLLSRSPYLSLLDQMCSRTTCAIVSYNYDLFAEYALSMRGHHIAVSAIDSHKKSFSEIHPSDVFSCHPHGSIGAGFHSPFEFDVPPWLAWTKGNSVGAFVLKGSGSQAISPGRVPGLPEIVLPGSGLHSSETNKPDGVAWASAIAREVNEIIFIGYNGGGPDYPETLAVVSNLSETCSVVVVSKSAAEWKKSGLYRSLEETRKLESVKVFFSDQIDDLVKYVIL